MEKTIFNKKEAAEFLGVSTRSIERYLDEIPHKRMGTMLLFRKDALERWVSGESDNEDD